MSPLRTSGATLAHDRPFEAGTAFGRGRARPLFRSSRWDALLLGGSLAQGAGALVALVALTSLPASAGWGWGLALVPALALTMCWHANTIAHNHLHNPLFGSRILNRAFELWMSVTTGIPQTIWKRRHLWHHAGEPKNVVRRALGRQGWLEIVAIAGAWLALAISAPWVFFAVYLPAYGLGLALCQLQGRYEHVGQTARPRAGGISCYARWYNALWFNDGYHVEHHLWPRRHWREHPLQARAANAEETSALPPILRWLAGVAAALNLAQGYALVGLERLALRSALLRRWLVRVHRRAATRLLQGTPAASMPREVCLVGGGLFPRTLLALAPLLPQARFSVLDGSWASIETARAYLARHAPELLSRVHFRLQRFSLAETPPEADLVVVPLGFVGDRGALYRRPVADNGAAQDKRPLLWVHDWIWRRRGGLSFRVSWLLFKRLNAS